MKRPRVLIVGPGRGVRGGITSVIMAYEQNELWDDHECFWVQTFSDAGISSKLEAFLTGLAQYCIRLGGADIIHIHTSGRTSMLRKLPFFVLGKLFRKATIVHVHAPSLDHLEERVVGKAFRFLLRRADLVIALSERWRRELSGYSGYVRIVMNPITIPSPAVVARPNREPERPMVVAYLGKVEERKGYRTLIEALPLVLREVPNCKVLFFGHGEIDAAAKVAESLGVNSAVEFRGWVDRSELFSHYIGEVDVVCLPSYSEGFPMAVIDAAAAGKAVVCTPVGGLADTFVDGRHLLYFTPGNSGELARRLVMLLKDHGVREALAKGGYDLVWGLCSIDRVATQMKECYSESQRRAGRDKV